MKSTEKNYWFEWQGGGYNSVLAKNIDEARKKARDMGKPDGGRTTVLIPLPETFTSDPKCGERMERHWFMD